MATDIAISLGTVRTRIYIKDKGIVLDEPSVAAVNVDNGDLVAVGFQAKKMVGRTSDKIDVIYPLMSGVISDFDLVEGMLNNFLKKIEISHIVMPRAVVCIPGEITEVEKKAVVNAISAVGVRKVCLIEKAVAAAIGAGLNCLSPVGNLVLNIGGGTSEMAVVSLNGIVVGRSIKIAGNSIDENIIKYVKKTYNLLIGERMAEGAKIEIGCVSKMEMEKKYMVKGRNLLTGLPDWVDLSSSEIMESIVEPIDKIIGTLKTLLEDVPPELAGDINEGGITLTGGTANLYGLDKLIESHTGLRVTIPNEPQNCTALGAGIATKYINQLEKDGYKPANPLSAEY